jgi:hypothetical protein
MLTSLVLLALQSDYRNISNTAVIAKFAISAYLINEVLSDCLAKHEEKTIHKNAIFRFCVVYVVSAILSEFYQIDFRHIFSLIMICNLLQPSVHMSATCCACAWTLTLAYIANYVMFIHLNLAMYLMYSFYISQHRINLEYAYKMCLCVYTGVINTVWYMV